MTGPIIVGVDGSPHADAALRWVATHAAALDAPVLVAYAFEPPVPIMPSPTPVLPAPFDEHWLKEMHTLLDTEWCAPLRSASVPYEIRIITGEPATALEELATAERATMIVVGRRGRNVMRDIVLGSVSRHLSRHAPCPAVIIPPG